jgi:cell division protein ZapA (FtsZ GTPase activity inhibitor)
MQNLITISIFIGDRSYRVKVAAEDEEGIRNMAKKLNDQIAGFKLQYAGKDMQDYLAMVLLSIVTESKNNAPSAGIQELLPILERIEEQLDKGLSD